MVNMLFPYDHGRRAVRRLIHTGKAKYIENEYALHHRKESFRAGAQRELENHYDGDITRRQAILMVNKSIYPPTDQVVRD